MSEPSKKASAVLFTIFILVGVGAWITMTLERGLRHAVRVQDFEIDEDLVERRLLSEDVIQGTQFLKPASQKSRDFSRLPTAYWHPRGPIGELLGRFDWFRDLENTWRGDARLPASLVGNGLSPLAPLGQLSILWSEPPIGVVQIRTGAIAGYARPFQAIDFYEANPEIVALSRPALSRPEEDEPKFTYLRDAQRRGAQVRVFEGPEIESLKESGPRGFYRLLVVETARHGSAPAEELITDEAFEAYLNALDRNGLLVMHVSAADKDFRIQLAETAKKFGLTARLAEDSGSPPRGPYPSDWLVLSPRPQALEHLRTRGPAARPRWSPLERPRP